MNFGEMNARLVAELGLDDDAIHEEILRKQVINEGVLDVLRRTRCVVRCIHLRQPPDVTQFVLDGILAIDYVEPEGSEPWQGPRLPKLSPRVLREQGGGYSLLGQDLLLLPPVSEERIVKVFATPRPAPMVEDADDCSNLTFGGIAREFHPVVMTYAYWKGSSYTDDATGAQGERYRVEYEGQDKKSGAIREMRRELNKKMEQRPPRKNVGLRPLHSRRSYVG